MNERERLSAALFLPFALSDNSRRRPSRPAQLPLTRGQDELRERRQLRTHLVYPQLQLLGVGGAEGHALASCGRVGRQDTRRLCQLAGGLAQPTPAVTPSPRWPPGLWAGKQCGSAGWGVAQNPSPSIPAEPRCKAETGGTPHLQFVLRGGVQRSGHCRPHIQQPRLDSLQLHSAKQGGRSGWGACRSGQTAAAAPGAAQPAAAARQNSCNWDCAEAAGGMNRLNDDARSLHPGTAVPR